MTDSYTEMLKALQEGTQYTGDKLDLARFRGVYAWWSDAYSPKPVKAIERIRTGECVDVGMSGGLAGRNPDKRMEKKLTIIPVCLTCAGPSGTHFTVFPTHKEAAIWCQVHLAASKWEAPRTWGAQEIKAAENVAINALKPWWQRWRHLAPEVKGEPGVKQTSPYGPYCPTCKIPMPFIPRKRTLQYNDPIGPCERCGFRDPGLPAAEALRIATSKANPSQGP
jgi:hypothetical protein